MTDDLRLLMHDLRAQTERSSDLKEERARLIAEVNELNEFLRASKKPRWKVDELTAKERSQFAAAKSRRNAVEAEIVLINVALAKANATERAASVAEDSRQKRIFARGLRHAARIAANFESVDDAVRAILADAENRDPSPGTEGTR